MEMPHKDAAGWTAASAWRAFKQARGKYQGPSGREAVRFLSEDVPRWILHGPAGVDEADLQEVLRGLQNRAASNGHKFTGNSAATYFDWLGSFLKWAGNHIVQDTEFKHRFNRRTYRTPVADYRDWERVAATAVGRECVVVALYWPNRRVETRQARYFDFHLGSGTADFRCKGGGDEVTDPETPLTGTQIRALQTYLPWRRSLSAQGGILYDTGHLLCRRKAVRASDIATRKVVLVGHVLVGLSDRTLDRELARAVARAFSDPATRPRLPGHSLRRGGLSHLRDMGASLRETQAMAHHRHESTTEIYLSKTGLNKRLPAVARLLDTPPPEAR
jgi:hypothetical protein